MSFPSRSSNSHPHSSLDNHHSSTTNSPTSGIRNQARGNQSQSRWPSAQSQAIRQELTINTASASASALRSPIPSQEAFRALLSPTGSAFGSSRQGQEPSRQSSVSSVSSASVFSPTGSAAQQSSRNSPHLASSTAPPSAVIGGNSRGASRLVREQSRETATASPTTPQSAGSGKQIASVVKSQLNILLTQLSTLKEDKDRTKWEAQVDKIKKVQDLIKVHK